MECALAVEVVVERGLRAACVLTLMCNSICSKHLDRRLRTSMFLMFSSRHVKGGYEGCNLLTSH